MKKTIQRHRTTKFFIEAAVSIIKEEGFDSITIRKVANKAVYNSATLYNYFDNLDHLKSLAALTFISDYTNALPTYIKNATNAYEINSLVWECFYLYSYRSPKIFFSIFGKYSDKKFNSYIKEYYELYPERLISIPNSINGMLVKENIYDRSMFLLQKCSDENFFSENDLETIDEFLFFIYRGIMGKLLTLDSFNPTEKEFVNQAMLYTNRIFDSFKLS